jgi:hypothetical protein
MILNLFREGISEPSIPARAHADGKILALYVTGRDMKRVRATEYSYLLRREKIRRTVARFVRWFLSVHLNQLRVVDVIGEGVNHGIQINFVPVARKLNAACEAASKILDEVSRRRRITLPHKP